MVLMRMMMMMTLSENRGEYHDNYLSHNITTGINRHSLCASCIRNHCENASYITEQKRISELDQRYFLVQFFFKSYIYQQKVFNFGTDVTIRALPNPYNRQSSNGSRFRGLILTACKMSVEGSTSSTLAVL